MPSALSGRIRRAALTVLTVGALAAASAPPAAAEAPEQTVDPTTQIDHVEVSYGGVEPATGKNISVPPRCRSAPGR